MSEIAVLVKRVQDTERGGLWDFVVITVDNGRPEAHNVVAHDVAEAVRFCFQMEFPLTWETLSVALNEWEDRVDGFDLCHVRERMTV